MVCGIEIADGKLMLSESVVEYIISGKISLDSVRDVVYNKYSNGDWGQASDSCKEFNRAMISSYIDNIKHGYVVLSGVVSGEYVLENNIKVSVWASYDLKYVNVICR